MSHDSLADVASLSDEFEVGGFFLVSFIMKSSDNNNE